MHAVLTRIDKILVMEESYPVMEAATGQDRVQGRTTGLVPPAGELTPEGNDRRRSLRTIAGPGVVPAPTVAGDRPTLCAGCAHRARFYAISTAFPTGIYPSDIGCYTLGVNWGPWTPALHGCGHQPGRGILSRVRRRGRGVPTIWPPSGIPPFSTPAFPPSSTPWCKAPASCWSSWTTVQRP